MDRMINQLEKIANHLEKQLYISDCVHDLLCILTQSKRYEEFLTVNEVAKILKRSSHTIRRWIKGGKLPAMKLHDGGKKDRYYIAREDVIQTIKDAGGDIRVMF